jgi:hypothetical protein
MCTVASHSKAATLSGKPFRLLQQPSSLHFVMSGTEMTADITNLPPFGRTQDSYIFKKK